MKPRIQKGFLILVTVLLMAVPLLTLFSTEQGTSFYEQRWLAGFPAPTVKTILNGEYFTGWETFLQDHIFARDRLLTAGTAVELALDRVAVNNIIVTEDNLLDKYGYSYWDLGYLTAQAEAKAAGYAALAQTVKDNGGIFCYLGLPQFTTYFADKYPDFTDSRLWHTTGIRNAFSAAMAEAGVPFVNMYEAYQSIGMPEDYYFDSDHHYTTEGAFFAAQQLMARLAKESGGIPDYLREADYESRTLPNPFLGSSNRKLYGLWRSDDRMTVMTPRQEIPFTRTDNAAPVDFIWQLPGDDTAAVSYDVYMGGDVAETVIATNRPELPSILIYGDSFSNPIEALVWPNFNETRSLDLRYYTARTLTEYIAEYKPDYVVCIRDESVYLSDGLNGVTG